jgi:predicted phosphodiesterase
MVGYGAHPNECCDILRERDAICLMGNHDAAALGQIDISWFNAVAKQAILWTRDVLTPENREWLLTLEAERDFPEWNVQAVHGSLRQPLEEYIVSSDLAQATFALARRPLVLFGHTHVAECYRVLDSPQRYELERASLKYGGSLTLDDKWKYLLNPGSCGQPRDANRQARFALLDSDARSIEVYALDYEWQAARDAIINAGLPRVLGERLGEGR